MNPVTQKNIGCARKALFIFLSAFILITALVGCSTSNLVFIGMSFLIGSILGIMQLSIFQELFDKSFDCLDQIFSKMLELLKKASHPRSVNIILGSFNIILIITLALVLFLPRITPEVRPTPLPQASGNGLGVTPISVDDNGQLSKNGSLINIGVIDETVTPSDPAPFDQYTTTNTMEKDVDKLIFQENRKADAGPHFTLAIAVPLSRTVTDNGFSAGVGLEDLKGAYLAQRDYNSIHHIKVRLIIANIGVKFAAKTLVPLVAEQLALYAKNNPGAHFIGVAGLPFSITAQQALPTLQQNDILLISPSAATDQLSNQPDFYRLEVQDIKPKLHFIQNILRPKSVVVMYDQSEPFSQSLGASIIDGLRHTGIEVSSQLFQVGNPESLDQPLRAVLANKPDLLFFTGYSDDLNAFKDKMHGQLQVLKQQGKSVPDMSTMRIMGAQALYDLGGYTGNNYSNMYFTTAIFPDTLEDGKFKNEYASSFDPHGTHLGIYGYSRPGPDSALTYDAVNAYLQAVEQTSSYDTIIPSPEMVKKALMSLSFDGVNARIKFNGLNPSARSDPEDAPIYVVCVDSSGHTHELTEYDQKTDLNYTPVASPLFPDLSVCA